MYERKIQSAIKMTRTTKRNLTKEINVFTKSKKINKNTITGTRCPSSYYKIK